MGRRTMGDNDRTLLEKAARAAGIAIEFHETLSEDMRTRLGPLAYIRDDGPRNKRLTDCRQWSPLTNDADALRLAVKLGLLVDAGAHTASDGGPNRYGQVGERDPYAATRRAIVRAAASLGEQ